MRSKNVLSGACKTGMNIFRAWLHLASIPEIVELQRRLELRAAQQLHDLLQVVAAFTGHPHLVTLQGSRHLQLRVLDEPRDLLAGLLVDRSVEKRIIFTAFGKACAHLSRVSG